MVLHNMSVTHTKSTFPMSTLLAADHPNRAWCEHTWGKTSPRRFCVFSGLGAKISGVDDCTFSSTGEAFSTIVLPHTDSAALKKLQADDVSLAYEQVF